MAPASVCQLGTATVNVVSGRMPAGGAAGTERRDAHVHNRVAQAAASQISRVAQAAGASEKLA